MIQKPKENKIPLLFVHIPKTGGGTVKTYFENKQEHQTGHSSLKKIKKKFYKKYSSYKTIPFEDYFKFAIFRNPWEKILSLFNFRAIKTENKYWDKIRRKKYNFKDWILHLHENNNIKNLKKRYGYYNYITIDGKIGVDYIINLHNLNEDFELIKKISNRTEDINSITSGGNKTYIHSLKHEFFKTYYDDKTIELVEKIHEKDIELFKFSFDNYKYADLEKFYNLEKIKNIL
jgi:hypothetical protein